MLFVTVHVLISVRAMYCEYEEPKTCNITAKIPANFAMFTAILPHLLTFTVGANHKLYPRMPQIYWQTTCPIRTPMYGCISSSE